MASPEDLFDFETFRDDPRPFYKFAKALYPGSIEPGGSHKFLAWLDRNKMLLRVYTQNIDALEQSAGVSSSKVVYAHGSLLDAACMKCKAKYSAADIASDVQSGRVPLCQRPKNKKARPNPPSESAAKAKAPPAERRRSLRRSAKRDIVQSEIDNNFEVSMKKGLCCGVVKPNITFFGEKLGNEVGRSLQKDYEKADCLIVMGTSLSVAPMSKVVEYLRPEIPRILINRNIVNVPKSSKNEDAPHTFHASLLGNCDDVVEALEERMKGNNGSKNRKYKNGSNKGKLPCNEACLRNQPKEGVLLFPGAVVVSGGTNKPEPQQKLVVHCDECQNEIAGKVFCCETCFDYDLCEVCYESGATMSHANGKHDFAVES